MPFGIQLLTIKLGRGAKEAQMSGFLPDSCLLPTPVKRSQALDSHLAGSPCGCHFWEGVSIPYFKQPLFGSLMVHDSFSNASVVFETFANLEGGRPSLSESSKCNSSLYILPLSAGSRHVFNLSSHPGLC